MIQAPDLIGPVIAYRAWRTWEDGALLRSMGIPGSEWRPRQDPHAVCHPIGCSMPLAGVHDAPAPGGRCGIYVMHTLDDLLAEPTQVAALRRHGMSSPTVAGEVEVWGRSERYERGRRVEWCRVRALYRAPLAGTVDVDALAETYGVPVLDDPDGKIGTWREREPEGSGHYWHAPWPAYRQRVMTGLPHTSYHATRVPPQPVTMHFTVSTQAYVDAVRNAMVSMEEAGKKAAEAGRQIRAAFDRMTDSHKPIDPDKPIPGPRKDHLHIAAKHRTRGARNV